ncbi:LTA synthase family protein [Jeotgalibacillus soli]|uniref:Sulfatase n=1 Tax=Jeotgalibacillus soli TaxID=889306 RepID=A0A0C2RI31_9BACL|nr:LTA synthase family protein [Jeotgalibacillus soli]KIL49825.1 sulfatase [Jeotgalibacillus soli]
MKKYYLTLPVLLTYLFMNIILYSVITMSVTNDVNAIIDWAQVHSGAFLLLITSVSAVLWLLTIYFLNKKDWTDNLVSNQYYSVYSSLLFSVSVGLLSAFIFLLYHLGLEVPGNTIEWIQTYPERYFFSSFILALIAAGLSLLIGEAFLSAGISFVLFYILAIVNFYKKNFRNEPLFPNDFIQVTQLGEVLPMIRDSISIPMVILSFIGIAVLAALWYLLPKIKLRFIPRLIMLIPLVFLIKSFLFYEDTFAEKYFDDYAALMPWNQLMNYHYNGPVIGMVSNIKLNVLSRPDNYSRNAMKEAVERAQELAAGSDSEDKEAVKPNIVFFMNETFWDPTELDITFSEDPLKHTRELMEKYPSGSILSPAFGGETANVEFEALASYSMSFFNPGGLPFPHILAQKEYPTFVSYLNNMGYYSVAMHPNNGILYMRQRVYPNLGFENYKFLDDMIYTEKDNSDFVSDDSVVNEVLDTLRQSDEPAFIHAVTIANHLPYHQGKYEGGSTIEVEGEGLSPEMKSEIEVFSEGIKRSDLALKRLEEEIQQMDEPTIVVFWGDHLPALGPNLQAYNETGFGDELNQQKTKEFYETPLLFISNFDLHMEGDLGTFSPVYLAPMLAEALEFDRPLFYDYLLEMKKEVPAFKNLIYMNPEGQTVDNLEVLPRHVIPIMEDYHKFQFDILSGSQFSLDELYE